MTKENIMQKSGGFTLLEVLVALAITGIAVTYIIQLFSVNLQSISSSGNHVNATLQAEARMRQILDDDLLEKQSFAEITDDGYRMDIAVSEVMPERTENLQIKLMEIDLTVFWKKGEKEKSLTFTTQKTVNKHELEL